jgi:hypothetical protein
MSTTLDDSHRWGQRKGIPVCRDCQTEGYEDEPAAFSPCPGPPVRKGSPCPAILESLDDPGHQHQCIGGHSAESYHFCRDPECRRWFGVKA